MRNKEPTRAEKIAFLVKRLEKIKAIYYKWSDIGSATLFADIFQGKHRYNVSAKDWFRYGILP